jgi:hypothetical protein
MTTFTKKKSGSPMPGLLVFALLCFSLLWSSCSKKDDTTDPGIGFLTVVNASPTVGTFNVYVGGTLKNNAALPLGGAIIPYMQLAGGSYDVKFTTASSTDNLFTKNITLTGSNTFSFFLIGRTGALDGIQVTDAMTATSSTQAFVRFANLSPDAPSLNLKVTGGNKLVDNQFYKQVSSFIPVDANTYSLDIADQNTGAVKATLAGTSLTAGKYYTVMATGLLNPGAAEQSLRIQVINNK